MKKQRNTDIDLMRLAILMPLAIAAAIWFSQKAMPLTEQEAEEQGLQDALERAVSEERYEDAAVLRDRINGLHLK